MAVSEQEVVERLEALGEESARVESLLQPLLAAPRHELAEKVRLAISLSAQ